MEKVGADNIRPKDRLSSYHCSNEHKVEHVMWITAKSPQKSNSKAVNWRSYPQKYPQFLIFG